MKCPTCHSTMNCCSEIHRIPFDGEKLDLHCNNDQCPARKIIYTPHMGVLIYPSRKWICDSYHLPFIYHDRWYALVGEITESFIPLTPQYDEETFKHKKTHLYKIYGMDPIMEVNYIPISTDDDMHIEAKNLFNRLIGLTAFA